MACYYYNFNGTCDSTPPQKINLRRKYFILPVTDFYGGTGLHLFQPTFMSTHYTLGIQGWKTKPRSLPLRIPHCIRRDRNTAHDHTTMNTLLEKRIPGQFYPQDNRILPRVIGTGKIHKTFQAQQENWCVLGTKDQRRANERTALYSMAWIYTIYIFSPWWTFWGLDFFLFLRTNKTPKNIFEYSPFPLCQRFWFALQLVAQKCFFITSFYFPWSSIAAFRLLELNV